MNKKSPKSKTGFTLVELLVVIAIIGLLIAILLPAVQMAREAARRTQCHNNLRQIGLALHMHNDTLGYLPKGWMANEPLGAPGWGWQTRILPFMEQNNLYNRIDFSLPIQASEMYDVRNTIIPIFICPSDKAEKLIKLREIVDHNFDKGAHDGKKHDPPDSYRELDVSKCNYSGVFGTFEIEDTPSMSNGTFFHNSRVKLADILDGLSNTMIVGERNLELGAVTWVGVFPDCQAPMSRHIGSCDHPPNHEDGHFEDFRSYHPYGVNFLFGDGSVHLITDNLALEVYHALSTISYGEVDHQIP